MGTTVVTGIAYEDSGISLMARIQGSDGTNITQSDVSSIAYYDYDMSDLDNPVVNGDALTVSDVVYDSLQTDDRWSTDSTGYNFRYDVQGTEIPDGNKKYRFEFILTPTSGENTPVVFYVDTLELQSS